MWICKKLGFPAPGLQPACLELCYVLMDGRRDSLLSFLQVRRNTHLLDFYPFSESAQLLYTVSYHERLKPAYVLIAYVRPRRLKWGKLWEELCIFQCKDEVRQAECMHHCCLLCGCLDEAVSIRLPDAWFIYYYLDFQTLLALSIWRQRQLINKWNQQAV